MARALVTGGSGFLGRHLVSALVARGERVRVLDTALAAGLDPDVELVRGSILDRNSLSRALHGVDRLYHLAAIPHLWTSDPRDFDRVNRVGTEIVLDAARQAGVRRVVHCSTEALLLAPRRAGAMVDETSDVSLDDMAGPYTRSKFLAEEAARAAARDGLPLVIVNPSVPIGPGDRNMTPPTAMLSLFLRAAPPFYLDCVLNLVDARDVALGMIKAADLGRVGERYILGGENLHLGDLLAQLERLSGLKMPSRTIPGAVALASAGVAELVANRVTGRAPAATVEGVRLALRSAPFDSAKAARELGYSPRPIAPSLRDAVAALAARETAEPVERSATIAEASAEP